MTRDARRSRRDFLRLSVVMPAGLLLGVAAEAAAQPRPLQPTPACGDDPAPTRRQTEGPFFKPRSPMRTSLLEPGMPGTRIVVEGSVLTTDCRPVVRALIDVWHADDAGDYDNAGYRLRGHQFTDEHGRYRFESIVPGLYPGRTRHFHVKVQAPGGPLLTTQLYFPEERENQRDWIFHPALVMKVRGGERGQLAGFDFVLPKRA